MCGEFFFAARPLKLEIKNGGKLHLNNLLSLRTTTAVNQMSTSSDFFTLQ